MVGQRVVRQSCWEKKFQLEQTHTVVDHNMLDTDMEQSPAHTLGWYIHSVVVHAWTAEQVVAW